MTKVNPSASRLRTADTGSGIEITIPAKVHYFALVFIMFWLCGWVFGLVTAVNTLFVGKAGSSSLFLVVWLGGWTVGGCAAMGFVVWMVFGREIVRVNATELQYIRTFGLFSLKREYELASIKRLRVSASDGGTYYNRGYRMVGPFAKGVVAFDYGASTPRFGIDIDEAEARIVVDLMTKRFRSLAAP